MSYAYNTSYVLCHWGDDKGSYLNGIVLALCDRVIDHSNHITKLSQTDKTGQGVERGASLQVQPICKENIIVIAQSCASCYMHIRRRSDQKDE